MLLDRVVVPVDCGFRIRPADLEPGAAARSAEPADTGQFAEATAP
jgi:hypothetical protein